MFEAERFLAAWDALAHLEPQWWPEVGRLDNGEWYCEVVLGATEAYNVGPAIRVVAPTAAEAIEAVLENIALPMVWPN